MYIIKLNGIPLENQPDELKGFEYELVRDGGIDSQEHIFRQFSDGTFTFFGDGYDLIVSNPICELISVEISTQDRVVFNGNINPLTLKRRPHKREVSCPLYDSGYSAMIREKGDNEVNISVSETIDGEALESVKSKRGLFTLIEAPFLLFRDVYDVLDVFKFLVQYLTNNKLTVESDYLTTKKLCIAKGGGLGLGDTFDARFLDKSVIPNISYNTLFSEVRKKLRIFSWIEGDVLRIEHEKDSYSDFPIKIINDIPITLEETSNNEYIYSEIRLGSFDYKPDDNFFLKYPYKGLDTWIEETFSNCNCALQNELNLVSEWIIDSNIILETLLGDFESRFDEIFLFSYSGNESITIIEISNYTNSQGNPDVYFNKSLQNYEVLKNWFGGLPECVNRRFVDKPCFNLSFPNAFTYQLESGIGSELFLYSINATNVNCDSLENAIINAEPGYEFAPEFIFPTTVIPFLGNSIFVTKYDGTYSFNLKMNIDNVLTVNASTDGILTRYVWIAYLFKFDNWSAYESGTFLESQITLTQERVDLHNEVDNFNSPFNYTFDLNVNNLALNAGEIVAPVFLFFIRKPGNNFDLRDAVRVNNGTFQVTESKLDREFTFVEDEELRYKVNFDDILDFETQKAIDANQRGYYTIHGNKYWINKLSGSIGKIGKFELISKDYIKEKDINYTNYDHIPIIGQGIGYMVIGSTNIVA